MVGTKHEVIKLQKEYLQAVETWTIVSAESYAKRVAGYLMVFGMPKEGDPDQRPSNLGQTWTTEEIVRLKAAILWMVLHEHVPGQPGQLAEDVFAGKSLLMALHGDKRQMLAETVRELNGEPFLNKEAFTMTAGILGDYQLDPDAAVTMIFNDLVVMAGKAPLDESRNKRFTCRAFPWMPREAAAMLQITTIISKQTFC